ncbi:esterase-like isoform X1 [Apium graveolens]|uniref:esterase-like isoform X1 n=1 Tax=Apium graveolens TaxID=4045 RepID=UPI003D7951C2
MCPSLFLSYNLSHSQTILHLLTSFAKLGLIAIFSIFNFGDSNSDTGSESSAFAMALPPNGQSFFGRPNGRYSNGRLLIDFLAASLGKPYLHSYLDSLAANFSQGASFSASGATITQPKYLLPNYLVPRGWSPFYLSIQLLQFNQFKDRSEIIYVEEANFKDSMPKKEHFSKALYTIDIGQNDIGMGLFTNKSIEEVKASVPDMIAGLKEHIKSIYSLGARTFWIHNTGPIGCLPYILTNFPVSDKHTDGAGCSIPHNEISKYYNYKLKEAIYQLRKEVPSAAITLVDIYSVKYSIYKEAQSLGFKEPLKACCGYGGKYNYGDNFTCFGVQTRTIVNGKTILLESCKNPRERISWDGIHYSEAADKIVFDRISTGAFSDPPNTPPSMACHKFSS